jgi:hypothetical protein
MKNNLKVIKIITFTIKINYLKIKSIFNYKLLFYLNSKLIYRFLHDDIEKNDNDMSLISNTEIKLDELYKKTNII